MPMMGNEDNRIASHPYNLHRPHATDLFVAFSTSLQSKASRHPHGVLNLSEAMHEFLSSHRKHLMLSIPWRMSYVITTGIIQLELERQDRHTFARVGQEVSTDPLEGLYRSVHLNAGLLGA